MCSMRSVRFGLFSVIRAIPKGIAFCHMAAQAPPAEAAECGPGRQSWPGMRVCVTASLLQGPPITENINRLRKIKTPTHRTHMLWGTGNIDCQDSLVAATLVRASPKAY
jgi:hypothetical protein